MGAPHCLHIEPALNHLPIDNAPQFFNVVGAPVLVIEIIGVFPHIYAKKRCHVVAYGVVSIGAIYDVELACFVLCKPHPARTKERGRRLFHLFSQRVEIAEIKFYGAFKRPCGVVVCGRCGGELLKVERVVQYLSCVVEKGAFGRKFHYLAQCHLFKIALCHKLVKFVHISLQMLAVVVLYGGLAYGRCKRTCGVEKGRHLKACDVASKNCTHVQLIKK